jgi:hypothetical protein
MGWLLANDTLARISFPSSTSGQATSISTTAHMALAVESPLASKPLSPTWYEYKRSRTTRKVIQVGINSYSMNLVVRISTIEVVSLTINRIPVDLVRCTLPTVWDNNARRHRIKLFAAEIFAVGSVSDVETRCHHPKIPYQLQRGDIPVDQLHRVLR